MGKTSVPISRLLSPDSAASILAQGEVKASPKAATIASPTPGLADVTSSSYGEPSTPASDGPVGTRAPRLYIIPTPPITIRRPEAATSIVRHITSPSSLARQGAVTGGDIDVGNISEAESDGTYSIHVTSDIGSVSCFTSDSGDSEDEDDRRDEVELKTTAEAVAKEQDPPMPSTTSSAIVKPPSAYPHPLYNSATPLVGQANISPGNTHELYGVKSLPILTLYIPDLSTLPAIMRHLHHPKESLLPTLLGWDASHNITTTSSLQVKLYEVSAYDLLHRAERFYRLVKNLIALGIGAKSTWDQVHLAHNCLNQVLYARGALPNPQLDKIAVPYMDGEDLPGLVFSSYTDGMIDVHNQWRAMREAKAQATGIIPPQE